jgi:hypothetical protein
MAIDKIKEFGFANYYAITAVSQGNINTLLSVATFPKKSYDRGK